MPDCPYKTKVGYYCRYVTKIGNFNIKPLPLYSLNRFQLNSILETPTFFYWASYFKANMWRSCIKINLRSGVEPRLRCCAFSLFIEAGRSGRREKVVTCTRCTSHQARGAQVCNQATTQYVATSTEHEHGTPDGFAS